MIFRALSKLISSFNTFFAWALAVGGCVVIVIGPVNLDAARTAYGFGLLVLAAFLLARRSLAAELAGDVPAERKVKTDDESDGVAPD